MNILSKSTILAVTLSLLLILPGSSSAQVTDNNSCDDPNYAQTLNKINRQWNANLIDHFYSYDENETGSGYMAENSGWGAVNTQNTNTVPLYRYWGTGNSDHFYSTSSVTPGGYVSEGTLGFVFPSEVPGAVPLYRLYRHNSDGNGDHLYTISTAERDAAASSGYRYEAIEAYVCDM